MVPLKSDAGRSNTKVAKNARMGAAGRGRYLGMNLDNPTLGFSQIAQGMGLQAKKVEHPDELNGVLKSAFELGKPNLVEVCLDDEI